MPRMGRVVLPNYPHHVVQRGHRKNKSVPFLSFSQIPGLCPTSPGCEYLIGDRVVSFYYDVEQRLINYIHVKLKQN